MGDQTWISEVFIVLLCVFPVSTGLRTLQDDEECQGEGNNDGKVPGQHFHKVRAYPGEKEGILFGLQ